MLSGGNTRFVMFPPIAQKHIGILRRLEGDIKPGASRAGVNKEKYS